GGQIRVSPPRMNPNTHVEQNQEADMEIYWTEISPCHKNNISSKGWLKFYTMMLWFLVLIIMTRTQEMDREIFQFPKSEPLLWKPTAHPIAHKEIYATL